MTTPLQYTIVKGDTYSALARQFNQCSTVTWQQIAAVNPTIPADKIQIDESLNIPDSQGQILLQYQVVCGDSYSKIAAKFAQCQGITAADIQAANPNVEPQQLQIGQIIRILTQQTSLVTDGSITSDAINVANCKGNWIWTWSAGGAVADATMGVAFSGWTKPSEALSQSKKVLADLAGNKYIGLGGGNDAGSWQAAAITEVSKAICAGDFADYDGIAFDIEVGDSGLADNFAELFAQTKQAGFTVLVSISHSAPYGISDAIVLMDSFFASEEIDYLSPQLYTTGKETANDYDISRVPWSAYIDAKPAIVPSIVNATMYDSAVSFFKQQGVTLAGFIQWAKQ